MQNKITIKDIEKIFKEKGFKLISENYINAKTPLIFKDSQGYYYCQTYDNFKYFKPNKVHKNNVYSIDNINVWLKLNNINIRVIDGEYKNINSKLLCKCNIDGYEWETTWHSLSNKNGCPKCGNNARLSIEEIKNKLSIINPNIEILNKDYEEINSKTKLKCMCKVDGYIWYSVYGNLLKGHGCKKCMIYNNSGDKCYAWKGGVTPLSNYLRNIIYSWKQDSFKKYNFKCDITGLNNDKLIIHHSYSFSDILKETMESLGIPIYEQINKYTDIELKSIEDKCLELHYKYGLGVCLCKDVHDEFHKIYGKGNNTLEQYLEFKQNKLNGKDKR